MAYTPDYADGFSLYNTAGISSRWALTGSSADAAIGAFGRNGRNGIRFHDAQADYITRPAGATSASWIIGQCVSCPVIDTGGRFSALYQGAVAAANMQVGLWFSASGQFFVTRATTTLATGTFILTPSLQTWVEVWFSIANSGGRAVVRVAGVTDIDFTGDTQNTGTASADFIALGNTSSTAGTGNAYDVSDVHFLRGVTGTGDFLNDSMVEEKLPTGAGNYTQWTPSAGSNFQNVDESPSDGDTTYNSSSTAAQKDTFAMGNLVTTSGTVHFVGFCNTHRKDDVGARTARTLHRLSGTDVNGTTRSVLDGYTTMFDWYLTKPGGGSWAISDVNGVETGYELIS